MASVFRICFRIGSRDRLFRSTSHGNDQYSRVLFAATFASGGESRPGSGKKFSGKVDGFISSVLKPWPFLQGYYHQMVKGFQWQVSDFKTWRAVKSKLRGDPKYETTYREHKAVFDIQGSLLKTSILLPLFLLPMGMIIIFIPVALFPQYMLPHCYWNQHQRENFFGQMHMSRTYQHSIIFHHLKYLKDNIGTLKFQEALESILKSINDGKVPVNADLMRLRDSCRSSTNILSLNHMPPLIVAVLSHINFLWKFLPPAWLIYHLNRRVIYVLESDKKLRNENLVGNLGNEELQDATFLRGLGSASLSIEANRYWLKNWIDNTKNCSVSDAGYILHAMIFLSHNFSETKYQRRIFGQL